MTRSKLHITSDKFVNVSLIAPKGKALHSPCEEVKDITDEIRDLVPYLIRIMRKEDGVGITANQVGINKAVFITNIPGDHIRIYVNPSIIKTWSYSMNVEEGCLTFPDKLLKVQRKRHVLLHAINLKGEQFMVNTQHPIYNPKTSALISVCLQHEMDHINGVDMRQYL